MDFSMEKNEHGAVDPYGRDYMMFEDAAEVYVEGKTSMNLRREFVTAD